MSKKRIAIIVGSLRKESFNRKMASAIIHMAPKSLEFEILDIGHLPLYNQDLDDNPPQEWKEFRDNLREFDGVLFVTPEYNRSVPGVLKNAIDIGSRPYGHSVWDGKPGAVISVSPSSIGGFGANHHLRQMLVFLNIPVLQQPEAYIGNAGEIFDESGKIKSDSVKKYIQQFIQAYEEWVDQILTENIPLRDEAHIPHQEEPRTSAPH